MRKKIPIKKININQHNSKIFAIKPIYHKERYPDWNNKLLTDKEKIWLEDFIERVKQVLNLDVG